MRHYFETFSKVITDYEIIDLPKKVDLLIIELEKSIEEHLIIMKYFKRFNIIEFKSENDNFDLNKDLFKLGIYLNGVLLKESDANISNTNFTLVSSRRLSKFLKEFKAEKIRNGLYIIKDMSIIPIHIINISELHTILEKEITALKELTVSKDLPEYLSELIDKYYENPDEFQKYFELATSNYFYELKNIQQKKGKSDMNKLEKNMWAGIKFFGIDEKFTSRWRRNWH